MIVNVWKPIKIKKEIVQYDKVDDFSILYEKGTSKYRVSWVCDGFNCKKNGLIHNIVKGHLREERSSTCNLKIQICKSCQSIGDKNPRYGDKRTWEELMGVEKSNKLKKEKSIDWKHNNISLSDDIKKKKGQIIINFDNVKEKINTVDSNYKLLELNGSNKQAIMKIQCPKNHIYNVRYLSFFIEKQYLCMDCFHDSMRFSYEVYCDFLSYRKLVDSYTNLSYRLFKDIINPNNLKRGKKTYHLDHMYSISEGFKNGILPKIIGSYINLEIITSDDNLTKRAKCSLSIDELFKRYDDINNI